MKQKRQAEKERIKAEEQERQRQEAERLAILEAHKRKMLLEQTRREEELRKEALMARQEEADAILRKVEADKAREHELRKERRRLIQEAKVPSRACGFCTECVAHHRHVAVAVAVAVVVVCRLTKWPANAAGTNSTACKRWRCWRKKLHART